MADHLFVVGVGVTSTFLVQVKDGLDATCTPRLQVSAPADTCWPPCRVVTLRNVMTTRTLAALTGIEPHSGQQRGTPGM